MKFKILAVSALLAQSVVSAGAAEGGAGSANGPTALAVAGVVAVHSSTLGSFGRRVTARLFDGFSGISFPPNNKITIEADSITCKTSNVDITARSCELVFGTGKRNLKGREANEVYATLVTAGVTPEGAAGSNIVAVTKLVCTLTPSEIKMKAGGGAECAWMAGQ